MSGGHKSQITLYYSHEFVDQIFQYFSENFAQKSRFVTIIVKFHDERMMKYRDGQIFDMLCDELVVQQVLACALDGNMKILGMPTQYQIGVK